MLFGGERDGRGGSVTSADPFPLPVQLVPINPACCRRCELRAFGAPSPTQGQQTIKSLHCCPNQKQSAQSAQTPNLSSNLSPNLPLFGHKVAALFASTITSRLPICSPGTLRLCRGGLPNCLESSSRPMSSARARGRCRHHIAMEGRRHSRYGNVQAFINMCFIPGRPGSGLTRCSLIFRGIRSTLAHVAHFNLVEHTGPSLRAGLSTPWC